MLNRHHANKVISGILVAGAAALLAQTSATAQEAATADGKHAAPQTVLNVRDFGAKGDAKTDDTQAIQAALDALKGDKHGKLVIPAGNYRITETLEMKLYYGPAVIVGEGGDSTLFWHGEAGGTLLLTEDVNHTEFRDLSFSGIHVNKRERGQQEGPAGILFLALSDRGGNMINRMTNIKFGNADVGIQMSNTEGNHCNADYYFTHISADRLGTFFYTKNNQGVDYLFNGLFAHVCDTVLHFERGGNLMVNNAQMTKCPLYLHIEGGGRNCATFTNINVRHEHPRDGRKGRDQLLKATNIKWEQALVRFIGFNDAQWSWFGTEAEERWRPLCEIGPGVNVTFESSVFNGPVAEVNGKEDKPGSLVIRESTFGFILPHQAIRAGEYGYVRTENTLSDHGEPLPNIHKWPELPSMSIPPNGTLGPAELPPLNKNPGEAIEALRKQRQEWTKSIEKE
jgi:hypothetical protein